MSLPQRALPLNHAECDRLDAMLSRFRREHALNNLEELDGYDPIFIVSIIVNAPAGGVRDHQAWKKNLFLAAARRDFIVSPTQSGEIPHSAQR